MDPEETITITQDRYKELLYCEKWMTALEAAGVDNWEGISYAHDLLEEDDLDD